MSGPERLVTVHLTPQELEHAARCSEDNDLWNEVPPSALSIKLRAAAVADTPERNDRAELIEELRIIADANPSQWDEDVRGQFQEWAQNRARDALARVRGGQE